MVWEKNAATRVFLNDSGMASLSDLERGLGVTRNWLSGFMSALEALGMVKCKGTRTYKLYRLVEEQEYCFLTLGVNGNSV